MKTILKVVLAVSLIAAPLAARGLWFYRGTYHRTAPVTMPEYASYTEPTPPLSGKTLPAPVVSQKPSQPVVLVDLTHNNEFTMTELEPYFQRIEASGARLEELTLDSAPLSEALKYTSAFIVIAPLTAFRPDEILSVNNFVARGGRLLVITDATRSGTVSDPYGTIISTADTVAANMLLAPYQISVQSDYLYNLKENEGNFRNILFKQFGKSPVTDGLSMVAFYAAHSISYAPEAATALVRGDERTFSSFTDAAGDYSSMVLSKNGNVLALGDLTFLTQPYNQVADNSLLMSRLVDFVLSGERKHDLADFPYLFTRPVAVVPKGTLKVNSELVSALSGVQSALASVNIPFTLKESATDGEDAAVLGLYSDAAALSEYLAPFNIRPEDFPAGTATDVFSDTAPGITLPGIGKVISTGTGLILYIPSPQKNTMVLMAGSETDLQTLIGLMNSPMPVGCLTNGGMALCSLASSSYSGYGSEGFDYYSPTPTPTP